MAVRDLTEIGAILPEQGETGRAAPLGHAFSGVGPV
jgi:hypothetical protein